MAEFIPLDNHELRQKYALKTARRFHKNVMSAMNKIKKNPDDFQKIAEALAPYELDAIYSLRELSFQYEGDKEYAQAAQLKLKELYQEVYQTSYSEPITVRQTKSGQIKAEGTHGDWRVKPSQAKHLKNLGDWRVFPNGVETVRAATAVLTEKEVITPALQEKTVEKDTEVDAVQREAAVEIPAEFRPITDEERQQWAEEPYERFGVNKNLADIQRRHELRQQKEDIEKRSEARFIDRLPRRREETQPEFLSPEEKAILADIRQELALISPQPNKKRGFINKVISVLDGRD